MNYQEFGFIRIAAAAPIVELASPMQNANRIGDLYEGLRETGCSIVLTPELSITGYSCEDLFYSDNLLDECYEALDWLARRTGETALIVGAPIHFPNGKMYNCGVVCANGTIIGAVPKCAIPNHNEFYEYRWFDSGNGVIEDVDIGDHSFCLSRDQGFQVSGSTFAIEVCEDLWIPNSPSIEHCLNGALIVLNLSASNELVAKADYRRALVSTQSAKCICAYLYASCGIYESTKDTVFSGHLLAYENGAILGDSERFCMDDSTLVVDVDVDKLRFERRRTSTYRMATTTSSLTVIPCCAQAPLPSTTRTYASQPFVPAEGEELSTRTAEVLQIQSSGLARRIASANAESLVLGLSGGLDSTLAFLVCIDALQRLGRSTDNLIPVTMPGPGTSEHTLESVHQLASATETELVELDIRNSVDSHLGLLDHDGGFDLTLENAQARERTKILFNLANMHDGLVVGTGDLSELALGWCTYNGDHMSSYNVNVSVPKTLVAHVVRWYAETRASDALAKVLNRIVATPISPELVPSLPGEISQQTEAILGPYEVHDFFLYHYMRTGAGLRKLFEIARIAFAQQYEDDEIKRYLAIFWERFFRNQFKRTVLPAGPKVGTVNLSPRGDWRMPDEAQCRQLLDSIRDF